MKLSERLLAMAASNMWSMQEVGDLLEEAAALAKSVESAPVEYVLEAEGDVLIFVDRSLLGQRVALVPLPQQSES